MKTLDETPNLRWFETFLKCQMCNKTAHGLLRGSRNESYGYHCKSCAEKRLRQSRKVREQLKREALKAQKEAQ